MTALPRVSWVEAEAERLKHEQEVMRAQCPDMEWASDLSWPSGRQGVGWIGLAPTWSPERDPPPGLDKLLDGHRLRLRALYPEAFPMVAPDLYPDEPHVPLERRTMHKWHVNGDGSLCLMQAADDWQPEDTAADLVCKASGWFIEYLLVDAGHREAMTERGIYLDTHLDELIAAEYG